jgi:ABC-2 type transport system ATP-binding protein
MMNLNEPVIDVKKLHVTYQANHVLNDVSLVIPAGAVVGIVGRNGAGKSTLLRCLMGIAAPTSGSASLFGHDTLKLIDDVREKIGYVPQLSDHIDWLTVWNQVCLIGRFYPTWRETYAKQLCDNLELPLNVRVRNLSLGDQQKLALVLAMAHRPKLLLLDEPVASLDPMSRRAFMRSLFEATGDEAENLEHVPNSIVMSSHLLSDLERIATHIAFMRGGRLQLFDSWDDLSDHYRLVTTTQPLDFQDGVIHQRRVSDSWRSVIDTRIVKGILGCTAMNLDELFSEINS